MSYTIHKWAQGVGTAPYGPLNATRLNEMEAGISNSYSVVSVETNGASPSQTASFNNGAIQELIDSQNAAGGGVIAFPPKKFSVTGLTQKPFTRLVGTVAQANNSTSGTVLSGTTGQNILTLQPTVDAYMGVEHIAFAGGKNQVLFDGGTTSHVYIRDCVFGSPAEAAIRLTSGAVEELYVDRSRGAGGQYFFKFDHVAVGGFSYLDKSAFRHCITAGQSLNAYRIELDYSNTVSWVNCIWNTAGQHGFYADGGIRGWKFDVANTEGNGQTGKNNRTTLTNNPLTAGSTSVTLAVTTGWANGDTITIRGAGAGGYDLTAGGSGSTLTGSVFSWASAAVNTATGTQVAAGTEVTNAVYDDFYFNNTIATPAGVMFSSGIIGGEGTGGKLRYSVNAEKGANFFFEGVQLGLPVYDPVRWHNYWAVDGAKVRQHAVYTSDPLNVVMIPGGARSQIPSPPGKDIVLANVDSLDNGTGTYGQVQFRKKDANRTLYAWGDPATFSFTARVYAWYGTGTLTDNSATPSVANVSRWLASNSSPTTITNFTGGIDGQEIKIRATNANTTITHGTNIFLKGAANKALANNEAIALYFDTITTKWYEA